MQETPCCPICTIKDHSGHPFSDIEDVAKEAKNTIESKIADLNTSFRSYRLQDEAVEVGISEYTKSVDKAIKESRARFQTLRDEIDRSERDWMNELKQAKHNDVSNMEGLKSDLDKKTKVTSDTIEACKYAIEHSSDLELISYLREYKDPTGIKSLEIHLPPLLHFEPSHYKFPVVNELVGKIVRGEKKTLDSVKKGVEIDTSQPPFRQVKGVDIADAAEQFKSTMIEVKHVGTMETGVGRIDTILHNTQNDVLVNIPSTHTISIYDESMKKTKSFEIHYRIYDMALTPTEDIIASDADNKLVVRIDRSGSVSTVCSTAPMEPWGVCVNDKQQIVVGVRADGVNLQ